MAETDSFIDEVSEEVRRDQFYGFLKKWGWLIAVILVAIVGGAAFNEWRKHSTEMSARASGDELRSAILNDDPAVRAEMLQKMASEAGHSAVIAKLARAGALLQAGDSGAAAQVLAEVADSASIDEPYRSLASLQRLMVLGAQLPDSERLATLDILSYPDAPFRSLALEQRALFYLEQNDIDSAVADLETILELPLVSEALAGRARQLLVAAGGPLLLGGNATGTDGWHD